MGSVTSAQRGCSLSDGSRALGAAHKRRSGVRGVGLEPSSIQVLEMNSQELLILSCVTIYLTAILGSNNRGEAAMPASPGSLDDMPPERVKFPLDGCAIMRDIENDFQLRAAGQTGTVVIPARPAQDDHSSPDLPNDTLHLLPRPNEGMTLAATPSAFDPLRAYWISDNVPPN
jgi:hypothetical protein